MIREGPTAAAPSAIASRRPNGQGLSRPSPWSVSDVRSPLEPRCMRAELTSTSRLTSQGGQGANEEGSNTKHLSTWSCDRPSQTDVFEADLLPNKGP